ncbi:unconventional myosin-Va isoform X1 [Drosophila hydei]|uniref:Unconventional myosin-Va isoform X1 n=1 Tax=Drosophila hydei TaxID=7224 RepID=A0A6J1LAB0_DROHY|nr:unconventional myosin-Va isoform X1 [Drosophila hydei]XP_030081316.1 unconventional myosin-Va isoform X1 [Drosophila hydei]
MSSEEMLYAKGSKIWIPHAEQVWESATLEESYRKGDNILKIQTESGALSQINLKPDGSNLPPLRNPAILVGQNDLTTLSYLHEPGVLYNLRVRFCERQIIYTYCGIILVAINPYADLPLYGPNIIRAYRGHAMGDLEPHIFALAEEAYTKLERENCNLSIIVSGESGAGKTVSAKYAMRYFAAVGGSESETQVERKVLASSPIMEAFGNAKTTRNDNSSRFGKFTKLLFTNQMGVMYLQGATMHTYLLEKSRVVYQAQGERNYHIFYQLCAARAKYPELVLEHQDNYQFLNMGGSPDIERISDADQFNETVQAMTVLGFSIQQIADIVKILAGILHLGNMEVSKKYKEGSDEEDTDSCDIFQNDLHLQVTGDLLKINADDLRRWLLMRKIESVNEYVLIPNNKEMALAARDALAKHIYAKLFQYIVNVLNKNLHNGSKQCSFIGVLDIYGFETFEVNSFEQFCINYANEKLQQQFNQHVFKLEQEEYLKEGITWTMIDFYDNQPCIDLIEFRLGVLDLLDEECRMPKGSDESWAVKLVEKCNKFPHFEKPRFGTTSFFIKHFSDTVEYDVNGFLEKNRDTVSKELTNVLAQSNMLLCKQVMNLEEVDTLGTDTNKIATTLGGRVVISANRKQQLNETRRRVVPSKQHKKTVGSQFQESLASLISTLHSTTPHYVRCIKPNDDKIAFKWETAKIIQQLRACGVLETVRISAAGFPSRWLYPDFYMRYQLLAHRSQIDKNDMKQSCRNIVLKWIQDEDKYRFGNTQIFFRAGQVAYLEQVRANLRKKYITIVQSVVRRFIKRRRYVKLQTVIFGIQRHARGYMARLRAQKLREARAALILSKYARGWLCRRRYLRLCHSVAGIQQYARGMLARNRFYAMRDYFRAVQIQRFVRGVLARRAYQKRRRSIIICQAAVRRFLARRKFKRMKAEAKTISHMENKYMGLENKIISMQQRIDELNRDNSALKHKTSEISVLKMKLEMKKNLEHEFKNIKAACLDKDKLIEALNKQLESERDEKMQLLEENGHSQEEWNQQKQVWCAENTELRKQVDSMIEMAKSAEGSQREHEELMLTEIDNKELNEAYQRAIKDKEVIENENYQLKEELSQFQQQQNGIGAFNMHHTRTASNASSQNEDDVGYGSAKNTLDINRFPDMRNKNDSFLDNTSIVVKLRAILEEEKQKHRSLQEQYVKLASRNKPTEDSFRVSELEVENEKLRSDYDQLRTSIKHGVEINELNAQHAALQEEVRRRREECIQLKAVLLQQSQTLRSIEPESLQLRGNDASNVHELMEAFHSQKLVNRQLESELKAITEEHNSKLIEMTQAIERLNNEKDEMQEVLFKSIDEFDHENIDTLKQNDRYLRLELKKAITQYLLVQDELKLANAKLKAYRQDGGKLENQLEEEMSRNKTANNTTSNDVGATVTKQKSQNPLGLMKFHNSDLDKILQRLLSSLTPRTVVGLLPGFPAYLIFMCIRYTDLTNADDDVRELLSKFVMQIKKMHRTPHPIENRVIWLVNSITLLNLLKQYGDIEEYVKFNSEKQNQQQLKNFNLFEYRRVILDLIVNLYQALVMQIQGLLDPKIVPAILNNDEIQRTRHPHGMRNRNMDASSPAHGNVPAWKQLIGQLEHFYKQFQHFGLDNIYAEQIFSQLLYFVCAVALNCLMLRGDICMWETGMIIRYNLGCIEDWVRDKKMSNDVLAPLAPLNQVSQLLQSRKSEEDVQTICDLCTSLNTAQVLKVMKSYKLDDYESEITNVFLDKLTQILNERKMAESDEFTMDQNFIHPFKVMFKYSDIKLEEIELPPHLNLDEFLTKI